MTGDSLGDKLNAEHRGFYLNTKRKSDKSRKRSLAYDLFLSNNIASILIEFYEF
jgi:hypothetical protein